MAKCKCGCGQVCNVGKSWIEGHYVRSTVAAIASGARQRGFSLDEYKCLKNRVEKKSLKVKFCACGCGKEVDLENLKWILMRDPARREFYHRGHHTGTRRVSIPCLCGCGEQTAKGKKWISGHNPRKKRLFYNGQWFDSSYEVAYVKYLDEQGIVWKKNKTWIILSDEDGQFKCCPDFLVNDELVDTTGYVDARKQRIIDALRETEYKVKFLMREDLEKLGIDVRSQKCRKLRKQYAIL